MSVSHLSTREHLPRCIRYVDVPTRPRVAVRVLGRPYGVAALIGTQWLGDTQVGSVVEFAHGVVVTVRPAFVDLDPIPEVPTAAEFAAFAAQNGGGPAAC